MRNANQLVLAAALAATAAPAAGHHDTGPAVRQCPHADAAPATDDAQRFINCAWNYIAWDSESIVRPFLRDAMFLGRDVTANFLVCGIPGVTTNAADSCGLISVEIEYFPDGVSAAFDPNLPLLSFDFGDVFVPLTRSPKALDIKVTLFDGRQARRMYEVFLQALPEAPPDLPYPEGHIFFDPTPHLATDRTNPPHGSPNHAHGIDCDGPVVDSME